jgi:hypothetical protein
LKTEPINRERDSPSTEDCKEPPSLTNPYKFATDADGLAKLSDCAGKFHRLLGAEPAHYELAASGPCDAGRVKATLEPRSTRLRLQGEDDLSLAADLLDLPAISEAVD